MTTEFISDFVVNITLNQQDKITRFISTEIKKFLLGLKLNTNDYEIITPNNQISTLDFSNTKKVPFSYFYEHILSGVERDNDTLTFSKKIAMTFDKKLCEKFDEHSQRYYEIINVAGEPIMYYVLFSIDEIYDCLYNNL